MVYVCCGSCMFDLIRMANMNKSKIIIEVGRLATSFPPHLLRPLFGLFFILFIKDTEKFITPFFPSQKQNSTLKIK